MIEAAQVWNNGERQASPTIEGVRADHIARYQLACSFVCRGMAIVDAACGTGYGSVMLASAGAMVQAIDISADAIEYGRQHFAHPNVEFIQADCGDLPIQDASADMFVSFETVEHVDDGALLSEVRRILKPGGLFLCSTPNQDQLPFDPIAFTHHRRHYTPAQFDDLLIGAGFGIEAKRSNIGRQTKLLRPDWNGLFNIAVARRG